MLQKRFWGISSLLLLISACTSTPIQPPPVESRSVPVPRMEAPAQPAEPSAAPALPPFTAEPQVAPSSPAVLALLEDARQFQQQGDYQAAQSRIQRAQRIAPRDPNIYYDLSQTHLELKDYRLAEQVALKGVSYTQGDKSQLKRFWLLLAEIRSASGDRAGAKAAREKAASY